MDYSFKVAKLLNYDKEIVIGARNEIKQSIKRSQAKRTKIESSSISEVDSYLRQKEELIKNKQSKVELREELLNSQRAMIVDVEKARSSYKTAEKNLEKQLNNESISNLNALSIRFLDVLRKLFKTKRKVEKLFIFKVNQRERNNY